MKTVSKSLVVLMMSCFFTTPCFALSQYASTVIDFSSQWSSTYWSAAQALGPPDTIGYGDLENAWAPLPMNGTLEYLTLGFDTPIYAMGAVIRETYGNGFVYQIDLLDTTNVLHTVWTGTDPSLPGTPVDFMPTWLAPSYLVSGIKIYVDTNHDLAAWEEIDSVLLFDQLPSSIPEPSTFLLLGAGLGGLALLGRKART